jgi:hypothetical protein
MMLIRCAVGKIVDSSSGFRFLSVTWHAAYLSHCIFSRSIFLPQSDECRGFKEGGATNDSTWRGRGVRGGEEMAERAAVGGEVMRG